MNGHLFNYAMPNHYQTSQNGALPNERDRDPTCG
jgi:hypothetical protein